MAKKATKPIGFRNRQLDQAIAETRPLTDLYRVAAIDQLIRLEEEPSLRKDDKLLILRDVLQSAYALIERLIRQIPPKAPELWEERENKSETPFEFIKRVYARWLTDDGLTRKDLRALDLKLYRSMYNFEAKHGHSQGVVIITGKARNSERLARLGDGSPTKGITAKLPPDIRALVRLGDSARARKSYAKRTGARSETKPKLG